tara:strand:- start:713 stop:1036 length:324 start_codon:yes stop_codon:yes gene_type:complete
MFPQLIRHCIVLVQYDHPFGSNLDFFCRMVKKSAYAWIPFELLDLGRPEVAVKPDASPLFFEGTQYDRARGRRALKAQAGKRKGMQCVVSVSSTSFKVSHHSIPDFL